MAETVYIVYENFNNGKPVANGINRHFINRQDEWQSIYNSGVINYPLLNPDAFLQSVPQSVRPNIEQISLKEVNAQNENWFIVDTSFDINAALATDGIFANFSESALQKLRAFEMKLVIWHAHECPHQHNPYPHNEKPLWFLSSLKERIKEYNLSAKNIYMVVANLNFTGFNWIKSDSEINLIGFDYFQTNYYNYCLKNPEKVDTSGALQTIRNKHYICLNATPIDHRFVIAAELFAQNLDGLGYISFLSRRTADTFHHTPAFLDKIKMLYGTDYSSVTRFLNTLPIKLDTDAAGVAQNDRSLPLSFIADSYFSLITESIISNGVPDNPVFITEKTFKPIYHLHPFIVVGCAGTLRYLRSQGYETFPEWFNEAYDDEPDKVKRINMIMKEVKKVCNLEKQTLQMMYEQALPKLLRNRALFLSGANQEKNFKELMRIIGR